MSKNPLNSLLDALHDHIRSHLEDDKIKVVVGLATESQIERLQAVKLRRQDLKTERDRKIEDFETKLEREYGPKEDQLNQEHRQVWIEIEDTLGLDHNKQYRLNSEKREVYERRQPKDKEGIKH